MTRVLSRAFALWLPFLVVLTGLFLFVYWGIQQSYRVSLNDPQIQMAEDGAARLNSGGVPAELVQRGVAPIDMTTSLAPWLVVYDSSGTPLESSAVLDGAPPHLPQSAFDPSTWKKVYAEEGIALAIPAGETRFSWQPRPNVRQAVVLVRINNGYFVAVGRNMRETESRVAALTKGAALLYGGTALGTLLILVIILALGWL